MAHLQQLIFYHERAKDTKNELKKVNHKGHKEHIGREAGKIKFLRPLRTLRLNHTNGTAIAVPLFVTFVLFVAKILLPFGCGVAALSPLWLIFLSRELRAFVVKTPLRWRSLLEDFSRQVCVVIHGFTGSRIERH